MPETLNDMRKKADTLYDKFESAEKNLKTAKTDIAELRKEDEKFVEYYNKLRKALKFKDEQIITPEQQELVNELKRKFKDVTKVRDTFKIHVESLDTVVSDIEGKMTAKNSFVQQIGRSVKLDLSDDVVRTLKEEKEKLKERKARS